MRPTAALLIVFVAVCCNNVRGRLRTHDQIRAKQTAISDPSLRRARLQETTNNQPVGPIKIEYSVDIQWDVPAQPPPPPEDPKNEGPPPPGFTLNVKKIDSRGGCFSSYDDLVFDFTPDHEFFEDGFDTFGKRSLWSGGRLATLDNHTVGTSSGACTVIAEAQSTRAAEALCSLYYHFSNGSLTGSTLASTGIYKGGRRSGMGEYTITSGTGCFAGSQGLILQTLMGGNVVRSSIGLE